MQGEYVGETIPQSDGEKAEKIASQLVARGGNAFYAVVYKGGLPGAGWKRRDEMFTGNGVVKDEMAGYLQPMLVIVLTFSSRAKMSSY